jgi:hypothetical protein
MIYKLDTFPHVIIPWRDVFFCLSIKQFSQAYDVLDFPFVPPEDLRQVAHDFAFMLEVMMRNEEYAIHLENLLRNNETAALNLLEFTTPEDSYPKRRDALFENTFSHLERLGYAEAVYHWGKQFHSYYKYAHRQKYLDFYVLRTLRLLLRFWAVEESLKQPVSTEHELYSSDWEEFIARWSPVYANSILVPLELSKTSRTTLQAIMLHHETKEMKLRETMDRVRASPKSLWEDYALYAGGAYLSIVLEGRFRIDLREWKLIVDALSVDEIHILEQWALQNNGRRHLDLRVPFPDFSILNTNET